MRFTLLLLSMSCTGWDSEPESPSGADGPAPADDPLGWVSEIARDPASFAELTRDPKLKAGWIAMHAHAYRDAIEQFSDEPVGRARAELDLGVFYQDLGRLAGLINEQLFSSWMARGGLPTGFDAPMVAALAANCSGGETAGVWANLVTDGPDHGLAMAVAQGRAPFEVATNGPYGRRMGIHRQVRTSGDPEPLMAAALQPVSVVPEAGFERKFWDPCVYRTLSDLWLDRAVRETDIHRAAAKDQPVYPIDGERWRTFDLLVDPEAGIGSRLLAPWPTTADLRADLETAEGPGLLGARSPSLRRLGVGTAAFPTDDPEGAKEEVRMLDAGLDAVQKQMTDGADPEGLAVVTDLRLVQRFRQEWLTVRARQALLAQHPRRASTYLDLARDLGARTVGPENSPSLFALTAEARLKLGHTREALDALHVLVGGHAEAVGLIEAAGDLAVLQGIDRGAGDSKED